MPVLRVLGKNQAVFSGGAERAFPQKVGRTLGDQLDVLADYGCDIEKFGMIHLSMLADSVPSSQMPWLGEPREVAEQRSLALPSVVPA